MPCLLLLACLTLASVPAPGSAPGPVPLPGPRPSAPPAQHAAGLRRRHAIECTPTTVQVDGGAATRQKNPIAYALSVAGPGSTIRLAPGTYPSFGIGFAKKAPWNAQTSGGTRFQPITVFGTIGARIAPSSAGQGDTIAVSNAIPSGWITFQDVTIEPGYRAGVIFYGGQPKARYEGYKFHDCDIVGTWDHLANRGGKSTWGVWGFGLADFEFRGLKRPARVVNLRKEHGFYLQNPKGDILIENVEAQHLGRTFLQVTARASDGPPGLGTITVRRCRIEDVGIARTDAFKGGAALTFAGRLAGPIVLEENTVRAGFDPRYRRLTQPGVPYGTGALVVWDHRSGSNGPVILRDNVFEFAPGCGDRPVASFGGCRRIDISGRNRFVSGGHQPALVFDPLDPRNPRQLENSANGPIHLDSETGISGGGVLLRGQPVTPEQRARWAQPLPEREDE